MSNHNFLLQISSLLLPVGLLIQHPIFLIMSHNCFYSLLHLFFKWSGESKTTQVRLCIVLLWVQLFSFLSTIFLNKSYLLLLWGSLPSPNCRWFRFLQIDAWTHPVVMEHRYWGRCYLSSALCHFVLYLGFLGFSSMSFWFHRASFSCS